MAYRVYTNGYNVGVDLDRPFINHLLKEAYLWSERSKDPSTKVGALALKRDIVVSQGYNGFPRKITDHKDLLHTREKKYPRIVHAEMNVIANAAKLGISLDGCTLICTHHPCARCAGVIINTGITRIIFDHNTFTDDFKSRMDIALAEDMFREAGVVVFGVDFDPEYKCPLSIE